jgi:DNA invertase Pin-like site-specific DNA recombinase
MLLGCARVSTEDRQLALQRAALESAGCRRIYEEKVSGSNRPRPELNRMLYHLRAGDVVLVSRLDRLTRSTRHPIDSLSAPALLQKRQSVS